MFPLTVSTRVRDGLLGVDACPSRPNVSPRLNLACADVKPLSKPAHAAPVTQQQIANFGAGTDDDEEDDE